MVNPNGCLGGISRNSPLVNGLKIKSATTQTTASSGTGNIADRLAIFNDRNLDLLRVEGSVFKNDLPGLISDSLLAPVADTRTQRLSFVNSQLNRLVSLSTTLFQVAAVRDFSRERLTAFQGEIESIRQRTPALASHELLTPLLTIWKQEDSSNGVLNRIFGKVTGLANLVLEKAG